MEFKLTSPAFAHGKQIPSKYTCDGENINPHLVIYGVPEQTKSLALIMEDPDAPEGLLVHWVAWAIPPDAKEIREHSAPFGTREGRNIWGKIGYDGPCPIAGTHRYFFRLYALDMKLDLPDDAGKEDLESAMTGHIVAMTELMGTYLRTNEAPL
jgi:Raf kinase inhibitor-like YbhB/YbcL family protein